MALLFQLQLQKSQYLQLGPSRGQYYGGSLPNVNQIGSSSVDLSFQVSPCSPGPSTLLSDTPGLPVPTGSHSGAYSKYRLQGQLVDPQEIGHAPQIKHVPLFPAIHRGQLPTPERSSSLLGLRRGGVAQPASLSSRLLESAHRAIPCPAPSHSQHSAAAAPASRLGGPEKSSGPWGLGSGRLTDLQAQQFSEGSPCRLTPLVCRQFLAEPHTLHGSLRPQAAVRIIRAGVFSPDPVFRRSGRRVCGQGPRPAHTVLPRVCEQPFPKS